MYKIVTMKVNVVVGPHMKRYKNKWQTTAGESQLGWAVWELIFSFHLMNIIEPPGKLGILLSGPTL
jgi:hypothetical protein